MAAPRSAFRPFQSFRSALLRQKQPSVRQHVQRRFQTADTVAEKEESGFSKFWNSKVGPKTVHFWAPIMKWGVVLTGVSDFARPASSLSITQNGALMATGAIWTRWCFVIKPRNIFLATVNFFLFCVGAAQVGRILSYRRSLKAETVGQELKDEAKGEAKNLEGIAKDPKGAVQKAENV